MNSHGAGKGDACRISNRKAYRANYDEIDWTNQGSYKCGDCAKPLKLEHAYQSDHNPIVCPKCYGKV